MLDRSLLVLVPLVLLAACESPVAVPAPSDGASPPLVLRASGYETAGEVALPEITPDNWADLHNVVRLSDTIISGGEPLTDEALERIAGMGVRTLLSVDGKAPNADKAAALGMRYVHVPIQYSGLTDDEIAAIAKTFQELPAPFYVHCFHGKHRGPAGAAVGRIVLDGAPRDRVLAEMRQWCGTAKSYEGLYRDIATRPMPSREESAAHAFDFPAQHPFDGLRAAMIAMARANDNLVDLAKRDWAIDPAHPDVDPYNEAAKLHDQFLAAIADPAHAEEPDDFREWMAGSVEESRRLRDRLAALRAGEPGAGDAARESMERLGKLCSSCHAPYRN